MDINARVNVNFPRVDVNPVIYFFILISVNAKIPLKLHNKFQPNIPSYFGVMDLNARVHVNFFKVEVNC